MKSLDEVKATASSIVLAPMSVPKASEILANELRERILSGDFPPGTRLPAERELVVQTQFSRATVREALRTLEVQGLLEIKLGRGGGAFVCTPGARAVEDSVALLIRGRSVRLDALLETREAIEPHCAALAAARRDDKDVSRMLDANKAMGQSAGNLSSFLEANLSWHVAVANASRNELLIAFMGAISPAIYHSTENNTFVDDEVEVSTVKAHEAVTQAIADGDAAAASRRMQRHVHAFAAGILQVDSRPVVEF